MIQIQETLCGTAFRKDCSQKNACQLRHSDEEVGRELSYYTRKFERATIAEDEDSSIQPISSSFPITDFEKVIAKGDGHCLIHAVLFLLEKRGVKCFTKPELLKKIKITLFRQTWIIMLPLLIVTQIL